MLNRATPSRAAATGCACGSGLPYAICHQPVDDTPVADRIGVSHRAFAQDWAGNAAHYARQGLYRRLAAILAAGAGWRVLDLGCGRGDGIAAMMRCGARVVGLDENLTCLQVAAQRLGLREPAERLRHTWRGDAYDTRVSRRPVEVPDNTHLVHSDLLWPDPALETALDAAGPFDAVTLWFPGTHKAREADAMVRAHGLTTDERYAVAMELVALRVATERLRPGGVLQIVGRAAHVRLRAVGEAFRQRMTEMAMGRPLAPVEVQLIPYAEPATGRRLVVGPRGGNAARTVAVSTLFVRR